MISSLNRVEPLQPPEEGFRDHHNREIGDPIKLCASLPDGEEYHMKENEWCCRPKYNSSGNTTCNRKSLLCTSAICKPTDKPYCVEKEWFGHMATHGYCTSTSVAQCDALKEGEEMQYARGEWCYRPTKKEVRRKVFAPLAAAWCGKACSVDETHCIRKGHGPSECATPLEDLTCESARSAKVVKFENGTRVTCCKTGECSDRLVHRCGSIECTDSTFCVDPFNHRPQCSSYFKFPAWDTLPVQCDFLDEGEELRAAEDQWCCRPMLEEEKDFSKPIVCPKQAAWCSRMGCTKSYCVRNQDGETTCPPDDDKLMDDICSTTTTEKLLMEDLWCCRPTAEPWTCPGNAMNSTFEYFPPDFNSTAFNETSNKSMPSEPLPALILDALLLPLLKGFFQRFAQH